MNTKLQYKMSIQSSQLALSQCIKDQGFTSFGLCIHTLYTSEWLRVFAGISSRLTLLKSGWRLESDFFSLLRKKLKENRSLFTCEWFVPVIELSNIGGKTVKVSVIEACKELGINILATNVY